MTSSRVNPGSSAPFWDNRGLQQRCVTTHTRTQAIELSYERCRVHEEYVRMRGHRDDTRRRTWRKLVQLHLVTQVSKPLDADLGGVT